MNQQYQSEKINELVSALCKAQAEFPKIPKTKTVDFVNDKGRRTKYTYADLSDVIDAVGPVLHKNGLVVSQPFIEDEKGCVRVFTKLMHISGQWTGSVFPVAIEKRQQDTGANITYVRRYTLCAILGIQADEDNDGQFLEQDDKKSTPPGKVIPPTSIKWRMNQLLLNRLTDVLRNSGWPDSEFQDACKKLGIKKLGAMTQSQYDSIYGQLAEAAFTVNDNDTPEWKDFQ